MSHWLYADCSQVQRTTQVGSPDSPAGFPCPEDFHLEKEAEGRFKGNGGSRPMKQEKKKPGL